MQNCKAYRPRHLQVSLRSPNYIACTVGIEAIRASKGSEGAQYSQIYQNDHIPRWNVVRSS